MKRTIVECAGVKFGPGHFAVIAGPCCVEGYEQILFAAKAVRAAGASMLRGGAFKPRTSPRSFQGLGAEGIKMLVAAKRETGMPVVSELMGFGDIELFNDVDMIQIGARNMQNYQLLKEVGAYCRKPVLLKRGISATVEELLLSAQYILDGGNPNVVLCGRGIRTFETEVRNTPDLAAVPLLHSLGPLPVIVDPSHAVGRADMVVPVAVAATAIGADGLMIEVHENPQRAKCDGPQSLTPEAFRRAMERIAAERALFASMEGQGADG
jgi:3-deoxy-7-phosphoheptulonate synthase